MASEFDLHGVAVQRKNGRMVAGPVYCPIYIVRGTEGTHPDKVFIDDEAFTATNENDAAKIAILRRIDTELNDLIWTRKIGLVTLKGVRNRKGKIGAFDVLYFAGPTFDGARQADDLAAKARAAAGLPTGLPGDRRIVVPKGSI